MLEPGSSALLALTMHGCNSCVCCWMGLLLLLCWGIGRMLTDGHLIWQHLSCSCCPKGMLIAEAMQNVLLQQAGPGSCHSWFSAAQERSVGCFGRALRANVPETRPVVDR
jgi:hypothetical protein